MKIKDRFFYLDVYRVFATVAVIFLHCCNPYLLEYKTGSDWKVSVFYFELARWSVPFFFMIIGVLFLNPQKAVDTKRLYNKNILRLFTALIFWSLVAAIYFKITYPESIPFTLKDFIKTIFHYNGLWFIFMMILIYSLIPAIKKISENVKLLNYVAAILFTIKFVAPTFDMIMDKLYKIYPYEYIDIIRIIFSGLMYLNEYCGEVFIYLFYFIIGHILHSSIITVKDKKRIYCAAIVSLIVGIWGTLFLSKQLNIYVPDLTSNNNVVVAIISIAFFIFVKEDLSIRINKTITAIIKWLSPLTFAIFLIHIYFLYGQMIFGIYAPFKKAIIDIPYTVFIIFIFSIFIAFVISKIPFINKYVM